MSDIGSCLFSPVIYSDTREESTRILDCHLPEEQKGQKREGFLTFNILQEQIQRTHIVIAIFFI